MTDIVQRIRSRPNDAPMPTERLLDEAADRIAELERHIADALRQVDVSDKYADDTNGDAWTWKAQNGHVRTILSRANGKAS